MDRRNFLRNGLLGAGALVLAPEMFANGQDPLKPAVDEPKKAWYTYGTLSNQLLPEAIANYTVENLNDKINELIVKGWEAGRNDTNGFISQYPLLERIQDFPMMAREANSPILSASKWLDTLVTYSEMTKHAGAFAKVHFDSPIEKNDVEEMKRRALEIGSARQYSRTIRDDAVKGTFFSLDNLASNMYTMIDNAMKSEEVLEDVKTVDMILKEITFTTDSASRVKIAEATRKNLIYHKKIENGIKDISEAEVLNVKGETSNKLKSVTWNMPNGGKVVALYNDNDRENTELYIAVDTDGDHKTNFGATYKINTQTGNIERTGAIFTQKGDNDSYASRYTVKTNGQDILEGLRNLYTSPITSDNPVLKIQDRIRSARKTASMNNVMPLPADPVKIVDLEGVTADFFPYYSEQINTLKNVFDNIPESKKDEKLAVGMELARNMYNHITSGQLNIYADENKPVILGYINVLEQVASVSNVAASPKGVVDLGNIPNINENGRISMSGPSNYLFDPTGNREARTLLFYNEVDGKRKLASYMIFGKNGAINEDVLVHGRPDFFQSGGKPASIGTFLQRVGMTVASDSERNYEANYRNK